MTHPLLKETRTIEQKAADYLTKGIGSWTFIIFLILLFSFWITANIIGFFQKWDPFPFILLNLVVGVLAAVQAPIILMSQNREEHKDRLRANYDYAVNKKAEREIREIKQQLNRIERRLFKK